MNGCKYYKQKKQVKYFNSQTQQWGAWQDTTEFRTGDVAEYSSPDCSDTSSPLTFVTLESGTFSFSKSGLAYSLNGGETWAQLAANVNTPTVPANRQIMWKGDLTNPNFGIGTFSSTGRFNVKGNVMSLVSSTSYATMTAIPSKSDYFYALFRDCKIVNAEELQLPCLTLYEDCYSNMFHGCAQMTNAPELPATTLAQGCYMGMFYDCTSLRVAPDLNCTQLEYACYNGMFRGCRALETAPVLRATTIPEYGYFMMFYGCTSLNYIKCLAVDISASYATESWVYGIYEAGVFVKNSLALNWAPGASGIPESWSVLNASD